MKRSNDFAKTNSGFGFLLIRKGLIEMNKKEWRNTIKSSLNEMSNDQYHLLSEMIKKRLFNEPILEQCHTIALTISRQPEVDTYEIIKAYWQLGKRVAVPKCNPKTRTMDFYHITSFSQLETVYMDLQEPIPEKTTYVSPEEIDLMIVPGIVFDQLGYRIGYGGGYYDRYLTNYNGHKISLAFHLQIVEELPKESHDIPVDFIITEKALIHCANNRKEIAE